MLLAFTDTPQRHQRLTIFPVIAADEPRLSYVLMLEALRRGLLSVEKREDGTVPHLVARNLGSDPVLILDCETFHESGENGTTNQSVLLGPGSVARIPISCTEAGKWGCTNREKEYSERLKDFPLQKNQVGILAFLDQQLLGLDALGSPELYSPLHRRLLTGHIITALANGKRPGNGTPAEEPELQALAMALEGAVRLDAPCPGHGEYCTLHGEITGGELRHNGQLVHLSVFPNGAAA